MIKPELLGTCMSEKKNNPKSKSRKGSSVKPVKYTILHT